MASPRVASSPLRRGSSSSASVAAHALRGRLRTGISPAPSTPAPSRRGSSPSTASASRRAGTSRKTGSSQTDRGAARRGRGTRARRGIWTAGRSPSARSRRSRTAASRRRPSDVDASAGGEPQAPLHRRRRRCASPSGSTRPGTSRTCAPTRSTLSETAARCGACTGERALRRRVGSRFPSPLRASSANAQEAHEAIRPAGDRLPRARRRSQARSRRDELALYELICERTIASQMKDATGKTVSIRIEAPVERGHDVDVRRVRHRDHVPRLPRWPTSRGVTSRPRRRRAPSTRRSTMGQALDAPRLEARGHETTPAGPVTPRRRLVQALEERGIGRPSTYASILSTIVDRGYVFKKGTALVPTFLAFAVTQLLEQHYGSLVDYEFTARMEDDLDRIAAGRRGPRRLADALLQGRRRRSRPARARHRPSGRDRRARGQLDLAPGHGHRRPRRSVRAVPRARRRSARPSPTRPSPDELTAEQGRGAAHPVVERAPARCRSGDRTDDRRPSRPIRART